ncbi:3'-phosphoadenosine 5'-phosphosulfate sulfotransferase [Dispira parvispora]|uniref:FAD synthase n=1 Tax=Dispira parvispora TaxID=1520584 RepID=A0A9W8AQM6_9FUNG|nr:3'-phosphoadenosine 5'-phosphosulfate sulfotransferase [Dispira parvispora]
MTQHPDNLPPSHPVYALAQSSTKLALLVRNALAVVEEALQRYSPEQVAVSFNGGKDCTVLLELVHAVLRFRYHTALPILTMYVTSQNPFPEADAFVLASVQRYNLKLVRTQPPLKTGVAAFMTQHPQVEAVFIGTRRTDPHGIKLGTYAPTDRDWPRFMRINPIIDWTYDDVWCFLRQLKVPYCPLYDQGYTSLGDVTTTKPNPALHNPDQDCGYDPAWKLHDHASERRGRV